MVLSSCQLNAYQRDGFVIINEFFAPSEVEVMRNELARLMKEKALRNVATDGDGQTSSITQQNLQICPVSPASPTLRTLPFATKVVEVSRQLLGDTVIHRLDQIFLKPAQNGAGTNWHQDNGYFRESRGVLATQGFGLWIALHDATAENATMRLIPGVYQQEFKHPRDQMSDHHFTCVDEIDEAQAIAAEISAGGVVLFNFGVPHATGPNTTDYDRAGLALHFLAGGIATDATHKPRGPIISGVNCDGGKSMWGTDLRGCWEEMTSQAVT